MLILGHIFITYILYENFLCSCHVKYKGKKFDKDSTIKLMVPDYIINLILYVESEFFLKNLVEKLWYV